MSTPAPARDTVGRRAPAALARLRGRITGRGAGGGSTTARELALRHRLLLGLSAALTVVLFLSYEGVHRDADPLRTSSAPAVLAIGTAQHALAEADSETTSSEFQIQISIAAQSLAAAAADDVGGASGRQALQTVTGLLPVYTGMVEKALREQDVPELEHAYLGYASSILKADGSGIMPRLGDLQRQQQNEVRRQTAFGWSLWLGWSVVALLALALAAALLETHFFLRRRFRRRYSRPLLAAGALLTGGLVTLVQFTRWTHDGMARTRTRLAGTHGDEAPWAGRQIAGYLANTGFRAEAAWAILTGGILLMALADAVLRRHINDYRFTPR